MLALTRHPRRHVARHDDDPRALEPLHDGQLLADVSQQTVTGAGIADPVRQAGRNVEHHAQLPFLRDRLVEVVF